MSDVLCDFCHAEWTEDVPMIEGHQGSCICGKCLAVAYGEMMLSEHDESATNLTTADFACPMCLESKMDREALNRGDEPGWASPLYPEAVICRRCIKLASGALHKDKDFAWSKPQ